VKNCFCRDPRDLYGNNLNRFVVRQSLETNQNPILTRVPFLRGAFYLTKFEGSLGTKIIPDKIFLRGAFYWREL